MPTPPARPVRAAGVFLAIGAIGGAIVGARMGQPSLGLVAGFGAGVVICLALWLYDRARHGG